MAWHATEERPLEASDNRCIGRGHQSDRADSGGCIISIFRASDDQTEGNSPVGLGGEWSLHPPFNDRQLTGTKCPYSAFRPYTEVSMRNTYYAVLDIRQASQPGNKGYAGPFPHLRHIGILTLGELCH